MTVHKSQIEAFLSSTVFGVVGASQKRHKFGNKILRCYLKNGLQAIPVNPRERQIEGIECANSVIELPVEVNSISIITPPQVTEAVVRRALAKGIRHIWMQPGAESSSAVDFCRNNGVTPIYGGPCLLVELGCLDV